MKHQNNRIALAEHRRTLRNESTDVERIVWQHLRGRQLFGAKFRRQHVVENYIVDFVSFDAMLVIELDGSQHIGQIGYDKQRDHLLESVGFKVLRFWNSEITTNLSGVLESIHTAIGKRVQPS